MYVCMYFRTYVCMYVFSPSRMQLRKVPSRPDDGGGHTQTITYTHNVYTHTHTLQAVEEHVRQVRFGRPGNSLKIGIVGVPNVGKSSFFNLLSK